MSTSKYGQPNREATLTAYRIARIRASAAAAVEAELLHSVLYDAREAGLSVRETADLIQVPKSTVARHRLNQGDRILASKGNHWMTPEAYVDAYNAAFVNYPSEQIEAAPFKLEESPDGSRRYKLAPANARGMMQAHKRAHEGTDWQGVRQ